MSLTPDDIERRTFSIEARGYDRDEVRKFLFEVAASMRLALHTTQPPLTSRPPDLAVTGPSTGEIPVSPASMNRPAASPTSASMVPVAPNHPVPANPVPEPMPMTSGAVDGFERLGSEVAELMRATQDIVRTRRLQAEADAEAIREEAQHDAEEIRRRAENDVAWHNEQAKRVLIAAQEQAEAIVDDAEAQGRAVLSNAQEQARQHARQVAVQVRHHADQILKAERDTLRRLNEAHADVAAAIDTLTAAETRPVLDLTDKPVNVHLGATSVDLELEQDPGPVAELEVQDPVVRMVRNAVVRAVDRAVELATEDREDDSDDAGGRGADPVERVDPVEPVRAHDATSPERRGAEEPTGDVANRTDARHAHDVNRSRLPAVERRVGPGGRTRPMGRSGPAGPTDDLPEEPVSL